MNNEDLLRTNTQLSNEMRRMREQMIEMERSNQSMAERFREMEVCGWVDDGGGMGRWTLDVRWMDAAPAVCRWR